jgi:hypothetical protein
MYYNNAVLSATRFGGLNYRGCVRKRLWWWCIARQPCDICSEGLRKRTKPDFVPRFRSRGHQNIGKSVTYPSSRFFFWDVTPCRFVERDISTSHYRTFSYPVFRFILYTALQKWYISLFFQYGGSFIEYHGWWCHSTVKDDKYYRYVHTRYTFSTSSFLMSVTVGVGWRVTKGGGISQGGCTNNGRLVHCGGGNGSRSSISQRGGSKWSLDHSGGGNGSGSSVSHRGGSSVSHRGGSSYNWSPEGDLVCVSVGGGKGGGDCCLYYCWSGGISYRGGSDCRGGISYRSCCDCRGCSVCSDGGGGSVCSDGGGGSVCCDGGGGSVCCDGGRAEVASRCGGEEERQKNL